MNRRKRNQVRSAIFLENINSYQIYNSKELLSIMNQSLNQKYTIPNEAYLAKFISYMSYNIQVYKCYATKIRSYIFIPKKGRKPKDGFKKYR